VGAASALRVGTQTALLLEASMAVPVPGGELDARRRLRKARDGEDSRPWSAGAGAGALATRLAQGAWMLRQLAATVPGLAATNTARILAARSRLAAASRGIHHGGRKARATARGPACRRRRSGGTRIRGTLGQPEDADLRRVLLTTGVIHPAGRDGIVGWAAD
jgi:hypothetical protein